YRVLLAADGEQAITLVRQLAAQINLVLLDMTIPVMSGEETFLHLAELAPKIPVVASTGYSQAEAAQRFTGKRQVAGFIQNLYRGTTGPSHRVGAKRSLNYAGPVVIYFFFEQKTAYEMAQTILVLDKLEARSWRKFFVLRKFLEPPAGIEPATC